MTGLEVVILIAGLIFVIASFFLPGKGEGTTAEISSEDMEQAVRKLKEAAVFQEEELKKRVQDILEKSSTGFVTETEEDMKRLSNEKIMAIDEFSNQVLEKIENNNQEVIFLYDMLQRKEEEMKSTMNKMEQTRRENKELFERLEELKKAKAKANKATAQKNAAEEAELRLAQKKEQIRRTVRKEEDAAELTAEVSRTQAAGLTESMAKQTAEEAFVENEAVEPAAEEKERREQVLELYQKKYSVKEISKELSMGQGEVKLIIDLYGSTGK